MRRRLATLLFLSVLLAPCLTYAQTITSYTFRVFNQGAPAPIQAPTVLLVANVLCNQTPITPGGTVPNPGKITWNDPVNAGKACIWTDPGTGVLFSLPFGTTLYESTLTATNASALTSPESARSNLFTHPGLAPGVLTGLLVVP